MNHFTTPDFWLHYNRLLPETRSLVDKSFAILKSDPHHASLRLKKVGNFWAARVGRRHRALAKERKEGLIWFWIGTHDEYERLIKAQ